MFSVIIPLYNKGFLIKRSIESVLSQSFQNFEIIVVDDGSTDHGGEYAKGYTDSRVHYFYKSNGGVSSARNYGISKSNFDWLFFLDADDTLLPNALEVVSHMINKYPHCQYFVGKNLWIQNGALLISPGKNEKLIKKTNCPYLDIWMNRFYPAPINMAIHKDLVVRYGGFDERISFFEDLDFSLRLLSCGKAIYTNIPIAVYNQEVGGLSLSRHPLAKEMAYYIPEIIESQKPGILYKALLYENIEMNLCYWPRNSKEHAFYKQMQGKYFCHFYGVLHWIRQKLCSHGFLK